MKNNKISFLSFDVEALPGRATDQHVDRLIWGKFGGREYGLRRICSILREHAFKANFLIDMSMCALYGDKCVAEIGHYLLEQGHELHVHLHSENLIRHWNIKAPWSGSPGLDQVGPELSRALLDYAAYKFEQIFGLPAFLFRAGGYNFNQHTVAAAAASGFKALSNFNADRHLHKWFLGPESINNEPFWWRNGLLEIPVDFSPEPLTRGWEMYGNYFDRIRIRKANKTFNLVMHSWSLLQLSENGYFDSPLTANEVCLHSICYHLKSQTQHFGYHQYMLESTESPMLKTETCLHKSVIAPEQIHICNICRTCFSERQLNDVCSGCGSRARHRQIFSAVGKDSDFFKGKTVLACHANQIERQVFLFSVKKLINFDARPVAGLDLQMDIQDMREAEDNSCDAFLAVHVLNHVRDDGKALQEIHRVLHPGGVALITVPYGEDEPTQPHPDITQHYGQDALKNFGVGSYRKYGLQDFIDLASEYFDVEVRTGMDEVTGSSMKIFLLHSKKTMDVAKVDMQKIVDFSRSTYTDKFRQCVAIRRSVAEQSERFSDVRSLKKWPSKKIEWDCVADFLAAESIVSGIHSFALDSQMFDIYIDIIPDAPAYVYFHGNCPRAPDFKLPVFSGSNVTETLKVTKIVPSDPSLLLDPTLELSWHAGSKGIPLQEIYRAIFEKIFSFSNPANVVFWGGSGGGFAALYYSHFFPDSTALVWNPQTNISAYLEAPVKQYFQLAFDIRSEDASSISDEVCSNIFELYRGGYENKIIYLQNDEDWHIGSHLLPFLNAVGVDAENVGLDYFDGIIAPRFYLYVGRFSKDHEPPSNVEIHCALQQVYANCGNVEEFNFGLLRSGKHTGKLIPQWLVDKVCARKIPFFRADWSNIRQYPVINSDDYIGMKFSNGLVVGVGSDGAVDWNIEFDNDVTTNIHELYSLFHVGRLLELYEEKKDHDVLLLASGIVRSFLGHVQDDKNLHRVMTNRGYSSADHSMSIRANVLIKLLQVLRDVGGEGISDGALLSSVVAHLWDVGDFFANPANLVPSNHGIMVSLTGLQIANQFNGLKYLCDQYIRSSVRNLTGLVCESFDVDGWTNENTVGYHSFILKLLREYVEYAGKNSLTDSDISVIEDYIRRGNKALEYCVRQDGSIPPIGDSPLYKVGLPSTNHSKFFRESGFLIIKDEKYYMSLVCGSRSKNHKQVDDSSITLSYDGEDLVIDGGSYCYDGNDPYRKYFESFEGHSGVYLDGISTMRPREYLMRRTEAVIDCFVETAEGRFSKARYRLKDDGVECERRIFVSWDSDIIIIDNISSQRSDASFTQSFLLAPQLQRIAETKNTMIFEGECYGLSIMHHSPSEMLCAVGVPAPNVQGWCSIDWRERLPAHQIKFKQTGNSAIFMTTLKIFNKGVKISELHHAGLSRAELISRLWRI